MILLVEMHYMTESVMKSIGGRWDKMPCCARKGSESLGQDVVMNGEHD